MFSQRKINKQILLGLLLFAILIYYYCSSLKLQAQTIDLEGTSAPDFELRDVNGKIVTLSEFKNKVVVLVFWAILCPPCRAEIPNLIELTDKWKDKDVVIIGLALEKDEKKLKKFVEEQKINYIVLQANKDVQKAYGNIQAIPTMFILDKDHKIIKKHVGFTEKKIIEQEVESLIQPSLSK